MTAEIDVTSAMHEWVDLPKCCRQDPNEISHLTWAGVRVWVGLPSNGDKRSDRERNIYINLSGQAVQYVQIETSKQHIFCRSNAILSRHCSSCQGNPRSGSLEQELHALTYFIYVRIRLGNFIKSLKHSIFGARLSRNLFQSIGIEKQSLLGGSHNDDESWPEMPNAKIFFISPCPIYITKKS